MKVRVKVRPSGLINGRVWPEVGETIDLPDSVVVGMLNAGQVEAVKAAPAEPEKAVPVADDVEKAVPAPARRRATRKR
ncbi:hypothetical protein [Antribacter gilvus]|uniref:hypothetical protein n=1 Tax=Antribacter gilvus TaxID=2304675 RepID=UPI000F769577|nr:hypothetical protein [Antribacter gilvus]